MAICRLMILDFMEHIGRYDEEGEERYSQENMEEGLMWAEWLEESGYKMAPFYRFSLRRFKKWVKQKGSL